MSEENRVLIEETDAARKRREQPEPKPKKTGPNWWIIAVAVVIIVGIVAGLTVYYVRSHDEQSALNERTLSVVTEPVGEDDEVLGETGDIIYTDDEALGGEMGAAETTTTVTTTEEDTDEEEDGDEEDETTEKPKTTRRTTQRTTEFDPQEFVDDFMNDFFDGLGDLAG